MGKKRTYVQVARREQHEQTRLRIVEALVALHEEVGPKNTTIAAIARRAGVQRLTVYRHFSDEAAMLQACSNHWVMTNPPPDDRQWRDLKTPEERVTKALRLVYRYFSEKEGMLEKVYRDVSEVEALGPIMSGFDGYLASIADHLAEDLSGRKPKRVLASVARHLIRFSTWQSLSREKLSESEMAKAGLSWLKQLV